MTALTVKQPIPVPGLSLELQFTPSFASTNWVRVWFTDAPDGSEIKNQLTAGNDNQILIYEGQGGSSDTFRFTPDRGGQYILSAQEYIRGTEHGGSYGGDPNADKTPTLNGSAATLTLQVAQRLTQVIGTPANQGELVVYVRGVSVVQTYEAEQGERSPRVTGDGPQIGAALRSTTVATKLAALVGTAATAIGTLSSQLDDFIDNFNAHLTQASTHANDDDQNAIGSSFKSASNEKALIASVNECLKQLRRHVTNDDASGNGVNSDDHHEPGGNKTADWTNAPLLESVVDLAGAVGGIADLHRSYEAHRASTSVHTGADSTNTLGALSPLLEVHEAFLAALASSAPTPPATANGAAVTLIHGAGFAEQEL